MANFRPALVVVDMQEDFCPPNGSLAVPGGRDIAPTINQMLSLPFVFKVGTQDWHPKDHVSFASVHGPEFKPFESHLKVVNPMNESQSEEIRLWPDHCIQNTFGAEIIPEVDISKLDLIVRKGQDRRVEMFSGFRDTYCVSESGLSKALKEANVTHVYVVGLAMDYCVKHTALHAAEDGFRTSIIEDASKMVTMEESAIQKLKDELQPRGVLFTTSDSPEILRMKETE